LRESIEVDQYRSHRASKTDVLAAVLQHDAEAAGIKKSRQIRRQTPTYQSHHTTDGVGGEVNDRRQDKRGHKR
jgi:hypothetical protein